MVACPMGVAVVVEKALLLGLTTEGGFDLFDEVGLHGFVLGFDFRRRVAGCFFDHAAGIGVSSADEIVRDLNAGIVLSAFAE